MNRTLNSFGRASRGLGLAFLAGMFALAPAAWAQQSFPTPDAAAAAFVDSVARNDDDAAKAVLGPDWRKYIPLDGVKANDVTNFLEAWSKSHRIVAAGDAKAYLEVGTHGWTMPVPIEKTAAGWRFDTRGTQEELRTRRIGRNELDVIQVVLALTDAQEDYSAYTAASAGTKQFAQKILSSPGKRDGLYWATLAGEPPSPLGPIGAEAKRGQAYHGYHYRILTGQGKAAPGGAKSYIVNGRMTGGYAVVAWPEKYGDTGVMTFVTDRVGVVYQKNLGEKTAEIAKAMTAFDPDSGWTKVVPTK